jgi:hypothetical protein
MPRPAVGQRCRCRSSDLKSASRPILTAEQTSGEVGDVPKPEVVRTVGVAYHRPQNYLRFGFFTGRYSRTTSPSVAGNGVPQHPQATRELASGVEFSIVRMR